MKDGADAAFVRQLAAGRPSPSPGKGLRPLILAERRDNEPVKRSPRFDATAGRKGAPSVAKRKPEVSNSGDKSGSSSAMCGSSASFAHGATNVRAGRGRDTSPVRPRGPKPMRV